MSLQKQTLSNRSELTGEAKQVTKGKSLVWDKDLKHTPDTNTPRGKLGFSKKNSRRDAEDKRFLRIANTREESGKTGCREYRAAYFFSRFC